MLDLENLLGKTVTVKNTAGNEFIGELIGLDDEANTANFKNLRSVLINLDQVIIAPLCLTAEQEVTEVQLNNVMCVMPSLPESAKDYAEMIKEEAKAKA